MCNKFFDKFLTVECCCYVAPLKIGSFIIAVLTVFEIFTPIYMQHETNSSSIIYKAVVLITIVSCVLLGAGGFVLIIALLQDSGRLMLPWLYIMFIHVVVKMIYIPMKFYHEKQSMPLYISTVGGCICVALYFYFLIVVNSYRMTRPRPPPRPKVRKPPKVKAPPKEKPQKKGKGKETAVVVNETEKPGPAKGLTADSDLTADQSQASTGADQPKGV